MPTTLRVASFNVENLFSRAKILNLRDPAAIDEKMAKVAELQKLMHKPTAFTQAQKTRILELLRELRGYVEIRANRGKLLNSKGDKVQAKSGKDWDGELEFVRAEFSEMARANTAQVIRDVRADVACIVEAENRPSLKAFDTDLLGSRYRYEMLLDGNDPRGIDVGLLSKFPLGTIRTHMFDRSGSSATFSRDCPEYEVRLPDGKSLHVLCNHLKSKGYDSRGTASERRKQQASAVAKILEGYDLAKDLVVVAGDMNDTPMSAPLKPLMDVADLHDALELEFGADLSRRWTYHYDGAFDQIDYLLVSKPLKKAFARAGVERRGIHRLHKLTEDSNGAVPVQQEYKTVDHWTNAASDHGAVWAEFEL